MPIPLWFIGDSDVVVFFLQLEAPGINQFKHMHSQQRTKSVFSHVQCHPARISRYCGTDLVVKCCDVFTANLVTLEAACLLPFGSICQK